MEDKQQAGYQARLVAMRKRLIHEVDLAEEALREDVRAPGELSNLPTHPADHAVEGLDAELAIAQNEEHLLAEVEAALERIEAGTYGVCQDCGQPIRKERLGAIPYTPRCLKCARGHSDELEPPC
jgi:DnaK suppressor protein